MANTKVKCKKVNKVEVIQDEPPNEEPQAKDQTKGLGVAYHRLRLRNQRRRPTGSCQEGNCKRGDKCNYEHQVDSDATLFQLDLSSSEV